MERFRGAILSALVLFAVGALWLFQGDKPTTQATNSANDHQVALFNFEKEELIGVQITRPDMTIELLSEDGAWRVAGADWRPSRTMVRRVAHQIHDLTSRVKVIENPTDFTLYGLGAGAITVKLRLTKNREVAFEVGDPNPTAVSFFIRPLPGDTVYTVKKSALDYFRLGLDEFRERKFSAHDADDADTIDAKIGGSDLSFRRTGPKSWQMVKPVEQGADRQAVRKILGRTGALKATQFVKDQPNQAEMNAFGFGESSDTIRIGLSSADPISLQIGKKIDGTDPQLHYIYRAEDDAVYGAKAGFLEAFQLSVKKFRDPTIFSGLKGQPVRLLVTSGEDEVEIVKTADGWRWPDQTPVSGSTPKRLASGMTGLKALSFADNIAPIEQPYAMVFFETDAGEERTLVFAQKEHQAASREQSVQVQGRRGTHIVDKNIISIVDDLFREVTRHRNRVLERSLDSVLPKSVAPLKGEDP